MGYFWGDQRILTNLSYKLLFLLSMHYFWEKYAHLECVNHLKESLMIAGMFCSLSWRFCLAYIICMIMTYSFNVSHLFKMLYFQGRDWSTQRSFSNLLEIPLACEFGFSCSRTFVLQDPVRAFTSFGNSLSQIRNKQVGTVIRFILPLIHAHQETCFVNDINA